MEFNWLTLLVQTIQIAVPALIVFLTSYFLIKKFMETEEKKKRLDIKKDTLNETIRLKMVAYERLILYLERMQPAALLMRLTSPGIDAATLKTALITTIQEEFNHNIAQQLYVSAQAWGLIKLVKEQLVNLVIISFAQLHPESMGYELSKKMLENLMENNISPTEKAVEFLNKEFKLIFD